MVIFYKNYKRSERTFLSIQSVKHLFPELDVRCLFLYDQTYDEYSNVISEFETLGIKCYGDQKKYNFNEISGEGSEYNGFYFTEGINKIQNIMREFDGKLLVLDEDCYFTTGITIKFLLEEQYDLAYCNWPSPTLKHPIGINGSMLSFNPKKIMNVFPLPEKKEYIEDLLGVNLYDKCLSQNFKVVKIATRDYVNYFGDGRHTNDINVIKNDLINHKIEFKEL